MIKQVSAVGALLLSLAASTGHAQEYLTGIEWQEPPIVTPGAKCGDAPSDAVFLFDGKDLSAWNGAETWKVEDGAMVVGSNMIESKETFGDCQLHIEWSAPTPPVGESQGRGNSGVFFGPYELQVLDSYGNKTYFDGQAASIYKQRPPMANAMRPPGEWNAYDIVWTAPRFKEDGSLESPAYITVIHNGVVVQNHFQLLGNTPFSDPPSYNKHDVKQPIRLQDHGNPVKFRNIWVRETKPAEGKRTREPFRRDGEKETPVKATNNNNVTGRVTVSGKPIKTGVVTLHPTNGVEVFSGKITDGQMAFEEAVKPGTYTVTIQSNGKDGLQVAKKFGNKITSGITVDIQGNGQDAFEFDLVSD